MLCVLVSNLINRCYLKPLLFSIELISIKYQNFPYIITKRLLVSLIKSCLSAVKNRLVFFFSSWCIWSQKYDRCVNRIWHVMQLKCNVIVLTGMRLFWYINQLTSASKCHQLASTQVISVPVRIRFSKPKKKRHEIRGTILFVFVSDHTFCSSDELCLNLSVKLKDQRNIYIYIDDYPNTISKWLHVISMI